MMGYQCPTCRRYRGELACDSFPLGIPKDILTGQFDHTRSKDGEPTYAPIEGFQKAEGSNSHPNKAEALHDEQVVKLKANQPFLVTDLREPSKLSGEVVMLKVEPGGLRVFAPAGDERDFLEWNREKEGTFVENKALGTIIVVTTKGMVMCRAADKEGRPLPREELAALYGEVAACATEDSDEGLLTTLGMHVAHAYAARWVNENARDLALEREYPELAGLFYDIRVDSELAREHAIPPEG